MGNTMKFIRSFAAALFVMLTTTVKSAEITMMCPMHGTFLIPRDGNKAPEIDCFNEGCRKVPQVKVNVNGCTFQNGAGTAYCHATNFGPTYITVDEFNNALDTVGEHRCPGKIVRTRFSRYNSHDTTARERCPSTSVTFTFWEKPTTGTDFGTDRRRLSSTELE